MTQMIERLSEGHTAHLCPLVPLLFNPFLSSSLF